jgi:tRNA dimethylallyltransferase
MEIKSLKARPLIVIVGPTASGKTSLAIELASQFNGEIICADSRTIYKGMDVGTAKPTDEERALVPHWGLDLVEPGERFTAADFKHFAYQKILDIRNRGRTPFLVGGTGLYVDSVIFDYQFGGEVNESLRRQLEVMTVGELQDYCLENNIELPENRSNKRYIIRAIERKDEQNTYDNTLIDNVVVVGITTEKKELHSRIEQRIEHMFDDGVVGEATLLGKKYGWESEAMTGNVYPIVHAYVEGEISLDEAKEKATILDRRLAKRQLTWLRRNTYIQWFDLSAARTYLEEVLANE